MSGMVPSHEVDLKSNQIWLFSPTDIVSLLQACISEAGHYCRTKTLVPSNTMDISQKEWRLWVVTSSSSLNGSKASAACCPLSVVEEFSSSGPHVPPLAWLSVSFFETFPTHYVKSVSIFFSLGRPSTHASRMIVTWDFDSGEKARQPWEFRSYSCDWSHEMRCVVFLP